MAPIPKGAPMSDTDQPDPDQRGEELDESVGNNFPPDRPPRLDDDGGHVPEAWEDDDSADIGSDEDDDDEAFYGDDESDDLGADVALAGDADVDDTIDDEAELVGDDLRDDDVGPLAPDDEFTGDETTRDYPTERTAAAAEEAAVHVEDDDEI
jgi:hypothetical protein